MLESFVNGIAGGFSAFGWCIAFIGGWLAVLVVFVIISTILRAAFGKEEDDE